MSRFILSRLPKSLHCFEDGWTASCRLSTVPRPMTTDEELDKAKPYSSLPGPWALPFFGNLQRVPVYMRETWHEEMFDWFKQWGPIFTESLGPLKFVHTCKVDDAEKLHRQEGKYPRRMIIFPWREWRDRHGLARGILTDDGPRWKQMRTILDKQMLIPRHVASYANNFNGVVTDFIERLMRSRKSQGNGLTVPNIDHELFHWSLETIGTVLYETRFGGLLEVRRPETTSFINAIQHVLLTTIKLNALPPLIQRTMMRKWYKMHEEAWEVIFEHSHNLIENKFKEIEKALQAGEPVSGFLPFLLASNMSKEDVYGNITDIMLGAVDTTSNTMQWILYELSRNQELQEKLHKEVTHVAPRGKIPTYENLQEMPLLKAMVKETLRLYPITLITSRILNEDIVLSGYRIPRDTAVLCATYVLGRSPDTFSDPLSFKPERWLRKSESAEAVHNFAWLPFGFGPRSCIGRRIAELEMHLLLARISQMFHLTSGDNEIRKPVVRGLLVPDKPVLLNFNDRI